MCIRITSCEVEHNWVKGETDKYLFEAKLFDTGSLHGIEGGRISKLCIRTRERKIIINYDRGWDLRPSTREEELECAKVIKFLENSPKLWEGQTNETKTL